MNPKEKTAKFREIIRTINPEFDQGVPTDFSKVESQEDAYFLFQYFNKNSAEAYEEVFNLNKKEKQKYMMLLGDYMFNLYLEKREGGKDKKYRLIRSVFYERLPQILKW